MFWLLYGYKLFFSLSFTFLKVLVGVLFDGFERRLLVVLD